MGLAQIARVRKWPNTQDGRFLKTCLSFSPLTVPEHRCGPCGRAGEHLSVAGTGRLARMLHEGGDFVFAGVVWPSSEDFRAEYRGLMAFGVGSEPMWEPFLARDTWPGAAHRSAMRFGVVLADKAVAFAAIRR